MGCDGPPIGSAFFLGKIEILEWVLEEQPGEKLLVGTSVNLQLRLCSAGFWQGAKRKGNRQKEDTKGETDGTQTQSWRKK